jgi:ketosteroid isomerase-like protein
MAKSDLELVRRALLARRSEFDEVLDPDVRLDLSDRVFNPEVYEGYEGIMRWRAQVADVWDYYRSEPEEFVEGDGVVVVLTHERARGKGSGVEVDQLAALLCRVRDGRVSEIRLYGNRAQALRDAGLEGSG